MVDNQTESLTHVDFDPATFNASWLLRRFWRWRRWSGWCHCFTLYPRNVIQQLSSHYIGRVCDLFFTVCVTQRSWCFWCLQAAEVLKIGFYPDKLLACTRFMKNCDSFVFRKCGGTNQNVYKTYRETGDVRWSEISAWLRRFLQLKEQHISFPPNSPVWPLLKFSMLILIAYTIWAANLTHKAGGGVQCATHDPITWSQDCQMSSWTSDSSCGWGWSQYSWHAGILLGLKLCTGNQVSGMDACCTRVEHLYTRMVKVLHRL